MDWRLLVDGAGEGAWNMAVDETLLLRHAAGGTPPTLRFYDWSPACISIGRFQDRARIPAAGTGVSSPETSLDLVRRPTGGRAVLHQYEVTYCAVVREELLPPESRSVIGAYRWLSAGWIDGLRQLGITAALARSGGRAPASVANCFSAAAQCDFLADGRKLIGAAQCRRQGGILQHGSLLLDADPVAWQAAVGGSLELATTLGSLGITASRTEVIEALCRGFAQAAGVVLRPGRLSDDELQMAQCLHRRKYRSHDWNQSGDVSGADQDESEAER